MVKIHEKRNKQTNTQQQQKLKDLLNFEGKSLKIGTHFANNALKLSMGLM